MNSTLAVIVFVFVTFLKNLVLDGGHVTCTLFLILLFLTLLFTFTNLSLSSSSPLFLFSPFFLLLSIYFLTFLFPSPSALSSLPLSSPLLFFISCLLAVCDVMGEVDMDGPKNSEGRILDPEFYPVRSPEVLILTTLLTTLLTD